MTNFVILVIVGSAWRATLSSTVIDNYLCVFDVTLEHDVTLTGDGSRKKNKSTANLKFHA